MTLSILSRSFFLYISTASLIPDTVSDVDPASGSATAGETRRFANPSILISVSFLKDPINLYPDPQAPRVK